MAEVVLDARPKDHGAEVGLSLNSGEDGRVEWKRGDVRECFQADGRAVEDITDEVVGEMPPGWSQPIAIWNVREVQVPFLDPQRLQVLVVAYGPDKPRPFLHGVFLIDDSEVVHLVKALHGRR